MNTRRRIAHWVGAATFAFLSAGAYAQNGTMVTSQPLDTAWFQLREMDMHLHAGMERRVPLDEWVEMCIADGRKVIVLLDHLELYRKSEEEATSWATEREFEQWYPVGLEGKLAFLRDMERVRERSDIISFRGWDSDNWIPLPARMCNV